MHPYVLVPLSALLVAAAIIAATIARAPSHMASRASSGLLALAGSWGLFDFMAVTSSDPGTAALWFRGNCIAALGMGPLCVMTLIAVRPQLASTLNRPMWWGGLASLPTAAVSILTPLVIAGAVPSATTIWRYEPGPLLPLFVLQVLVLPIVTLVGLARPPGTNANGEPPGSDLMLGVAITVPLCITMLTEVCLPLLGVDFPRFGPLSMAMLGGASWLMYFNGFDGAISDAGLARRILERLPTGIALIGSEGEIRAVNKPLASWIGVDRRDLIGTSISHLVHIPLNELLALDGERECQLSTANDDAFRIATSAAPIHDRQGGAVGYVVVFRDVREQTDLRSHIHSADQMASVGELAAGIAHEVNNPVAFIQANLNLLRRHYQELADLLDDDPVELEGTEATLDLGIVGVDEALEGLGRVAAIVREVRAFAHTGHGKRQFVDVNDLLESALQLATLPQEFDHAIVRSFDELPLIRCGALELKQAFFGLTQWVLAGVSPLDRVEVSSERHGDLVRICIGPRPEDRDLEPSGNEGISSARSGIALVIARQIIQQHRGELRVSDDDRRGTQVNLWLPLDAWTSEDDLQERAPA